MTSPTVYLASVRGLKDCVVNGPGEPSYALLISFYYLDVFLRHRADYFYREWVMDSGAFSAHNKGVEIDLTKYIETCKELSATDQNLKEIYALDVIGDWRASIKNTERMWNEGVQAIPCYHAGEPWYVLNYLAQNYPKIAIGGVARAKIDVKVAFSKECFARVWPKKVHGFGMTGYRTTGGDLIIDFPFHSTDSTNWEMGPLAFGNWCKFGRMDARGKDFANNRVDLRSNIKYFLNLEAKARVRWRKEMQALT